ncbi:MAG: isocitrate lyase family protein [Ekhidna sp.]|nr:isocitrate lyase family protein [Ekhidna sp.]
MNAAVIEAESFFNSERFKAVNRLYTARQVAEQQGTIYNDYSIAKKAAHDFYTKLRELFNQKKSITTYGPYSPSQAVMMKKSGIEGIYLGGWATSAKGSMDEDPGADLASYPLSQVPNEAASIVRALLAADKNQSFARFRMSEEEREGTPIVDFSPYIIADADTGHGGDAQVRNLVRRFVEAGVPGYHIEDQKPGTKKCGHQGGKVLVACDEQIKRLNAARLQLDIMRVEGIIVARTDAEAATLIETISDERDQPFVLGSTNPEIPSYKSVIISLQTILQDKGIPVFGHELYTTKVINEDAVQWLLKTGALEIAEEKLALVKSDQGYEFEQAFDEILAAVVTKWEEEAGVKTMGEALIDQVNLLLQGGMDLTLAASWKEEIKQMSFTEIVLFAEEQGISFDWDCEVMRTPEGYYQVRGGIPFAVAKSLAVAPFADILWMETKTADLADAKEFADAIHEVYPEMMLAYNLSPSFNWDSTGMTEEEMQQFPEELAKMGFVFNFITYGGHQIDGLAADEFSNALNTEGMLALAKVQRKFRLLDSPYKTPQTHVGGKRMDGALSASSGRTATTKAMGKGSTQFQHLVNTELPVKTLNEWLTNWAQFNEVQGDIKAKLKPHSPGSTILELAVSVDDTVISNVVFSSLVDRNKTSILSIRDQNTFNTVYRKRRLMTLIHLFLLNRFKANVVHYLTPTKDNHKQCEAMTKRGIYQNFNEEVGKIIVAEVNKERIASYLSESSEIEELIEIQPKTTSVV